MTAMTTMTNATNATTTGRRIVFAALCMAGMSGCSGPSQPITVPVSGTVSYDGKPIADGSITFAAVDGSCAPNVLQIAAGRYEGRVVVGEKRIEIRAMRKAERTGSAATGPGGDEGPVLENFIPAAYNDASQLTKTIEPPGPVVIDLDLTVQR
jgi:hypothetical protein